MKLLAYYASKDTKPQKDSDNERKCPISPYRQPRRHGNPNLEAKPKRDQHCYEMDNFQQTTMVRSACWIRDLCRRQKLSKAMSVRWCFSLGFIYLVDDCMWLSPRVPMFRPVVLDVST